MLSLIKQRAITAVSALVSAVGGAVMMVLTLTVLACWLLSIPLDATNPTNWIFWSLAITMGVASLVVGLCIWVKGSVSREDKSLKVTATQAILLGVLEGFALGALGFGIQQMSMALVLLRIHGPLAR
jgi:hypothetical protein